MKKSFLAFAMFIGVAATAQELTSKKGFPILPEAGDWGLGVGANSTLNYLGNLMNGNNVAPSFSWQNNNVITGKYFKDANTAYRVGLRLGFNSGKTTATSPTDGNISDTSFSSNNINLAAGIQKYRGKGRLRGFYGAEAGIGLAGSKLTYNYQGNAPANSVLEAKAGGTFSFNVRGFVGVEYYFAPKISLGGEVGWGLGLSSTGAGSVTTADGNGGSKATDGPAKSSSFGLDTDNAGGSINLNFYF